MTRRLISITAVAIALPLGVLTAPVWIVLAVAADIVGRLWRFPTVRLGLFGIVYLLHQWAGLGLAAWLILSEKLTGRSRLLDYREVQLWWAASLLRAARRLLGVDFTVEHDTPLPDHSFALISRHASMIDAVLPSVLIVGRLRRYVHYVLKDDLLWDPAIATYGIRLGNWFVARGSRTEDELEGIARLARNAQPDSVLVIFPEGTYATPTSRRRVAASLAAKAEAGELAPEVVEYARGLRNLLPPKPAGTLTLLANRPDADVVILGHVGLEGVAQLKGLRRRLPLTHPVVVRWWSHRRDELPQDPDELEDWLQQRWIELDRWVADTEAGVGAEPV
jgi:1-acyl-sn-glycerol-3-phosphate acyltransferase